MAGFFFFLFASMRYLSRQKKTRHKGGFVILKRDPGLRRDDVTALPCAARMGRYVT
jgi:hypothetical protein